MTIHQDPLLDGAYERIEKLEQDVGKLTAFVANMHAEVGAALNSGKGPDCEDEGAFHDPNCKCAKDESV